VGTSRAKDSEEFTRGEIVKLKRDGTYKIGRVIKILEHVCHVHWFCTIEERFRITTETFDRLSSTNDEEKAFLKNEAIKHNARLYLAYTENQKKKSALKREALRARY